jgi:hypothetical protein
MSKIDLVKSVCQKAYIKFKLSMIMPKRVKLVCNEDVRPHLVEDPDGLQVQDECDFKWVEAWKTAVKNKVD